MNTPENDAQTVAAKTRAGKSGTDSESVNDTFAPSGVPESALPAGPPVSLAENSGEGLPLSPLPDDVVPEHLTAEDPAAAEEPVEETHSGSPEPGHAAHDALPALPPLSSGLNAYRNDPGSLIDSVDRLGTLESSYWSGAQYVHDHSHTHTAGLRHNAIPPSRPDGNGPGDPGNPGGSADQTLALHFLEGARYPAANTVLESDPFGIQLYMELSRPVQTGDSMILQISGTAHMSAADAAAVSRGDYAHWSDWTVKYSGGELSGAECIKEGPSGELIFSLPEGADEVWIQVPLVNNNISEADRTFDYTVLYSGPYGITEGQYGSIVIVDENRAQDIAPDWTPPEPGLADDSITAPIVRIQVWDGASWCASNAVLKSDSPSMLYRFQLLTAEGQPHTAEEDIRVTVRASGVNGLEVSGDSADVDLSGLESAFLAAGAVDVRYDPQTGLLSFSLPAGWNGGDIPFTASVLSGAHINGLTGGESLRFDVIAAEGNEVYRGAGAATEVTDVPTVSVAVSAANFKEPGVDSDLPDQVTFTFTLDVAASKDLAVKLDWSASSAAVTPDDYEISFDGGVSWQAAGETLPDSVVFAAGEREAVIVVRAREDTEIEDPETFTVTVAPQGSGSGGYHPATDATVSAVLHDATAEAIPPPPSGPEARLTVDSVSGAGAYQSGQAAYVMENTGEVVYKLSLNNWGTDTPFSGSRGDVTVTLQVTGSTGTVLDGADIDVNFDNGSALPGDWSYDSVTGLITILVPDGVQEITFTARPVADSDVEAANSGGNWVQESVNVAITKVEGSGALISPAHKTATAHIVDVPTVSVAAAEYVSESAGELAFTVTLTSPSLVDVSIPLSWSDKSVNGVDYDLSDCTIVSGGQSLTHVDLSGPDPVLAIPAGQTTAVIKVPVTDDDLTNANQNVTLELLPQNGIGMADVSDDFHVDPDPGRNMATTTIVEDTLPWAGANPAPTEHGVLEGPVVRMALCDSNGVLMLDNGNIPVVCGVPESQGTTYFRPVLLHADGTLYTGALTEDVTVNFSIVAHGQNTVFAATDPGSVWNGTDDFYFDFQSPYSAVPEYYLSSSVISGYTVSLTLNHSSYDNTAASGYILQGLINPDNNAETGEGFTVTVNTASGQESSPGAALDANFAEIPLVGVRQVDTHYSESQSFAAFELVCSESFVAEQTIWLRISGGINAADLDTSAMTAASDVEYYTVDSGHFLKVTVPAGDLSKTFHVAIRDDALTESAETITVTVLPQDGGSLPPASPAYRVTSVAADKTASAVIVDDTATTWPGGGTAPSDHGTLEGPEVALSIVSAGNAAKGDGTVTADAKSATVMENSADGVVYKISLYDKGATTLYSGSDTQDIIVTLQITPGAIDFTNLPDDSTYDASSGTLTIKVPAGTKEVTFTGKPFADSDSTEGTETFRINIDNVTGNESSVSTGNSSVTTDILDVPTASVATSTAYVTESGGEMEFIITLTSPSLVDVFIPLSWSGAATPGLDYDNAQCATLCNSVTTPNVDLSGSTPGVTIPAGQTSITITVPVKDDVLTELDETVILTLGNQGGATNNANDFHVNSGANSAIATIVDDTTTWPGGGGTEPGDHGTLEGPLVKLVLTNLEGTALSDADAARIMENGGTVTYTLKLVQRGDESLAYTGQHEKITVELSATGQNSLTLNGTTDFTFSGLGTGSYNSATGVITAIIPANAVSSSFTGQPVADVREEAVYSGGNYTQESVVVAVTSVSGAEAGKAATQTSTEVTVVDVPTARVASALVYYPESPDPDPEAPAGTRSEMVFTVTLSSPSDKSVTVNLDWSGTATKGVDYDPTACSVRVGDSGAFATVNCSGALTIPAGQTTVTIRVPIIDDKLSESNESVILTLKPETGTTGAPTDNYHVNSGDGSNTATATIVDDANPWPATAAPGNEAPDWHSGATPKTGYDPSDPSDPVDDEYYARADGPRVAVSAVSGNENQSGSSRWSAHHGTDDRYDGNARKPIVLEGVDQAGEITYRIELLDGDAPFDANEAVTVTLDIASLYGAEYGTIKGLHDYYIQPASLQELIDNYNATFDPATGRLVATIPAGQSGFDLVINTVPDNLTEAGRKEYDDKGEYVENRPDEAFSITVAKVAGNEACAHETKGRIDTTIDEDHDGIRVSITAESATNVPEGIEAVFILRLSAPADEDVFVVLEPQEGSRRNEYDFDGSTLTKTIPAGTTSIMIEVMVYNDTFSEPTEEFSMRIVHVEGGEAVINQSRESALCTIVDDMNGPVVGITANAPEFEESSGEVHFTLSLSDPSLYPGNGVPSETMKVTLKINGSGDDPADLSDFDLSTLECVEFGTGTPDKVKVLSVNAATGEIVFEIPKDFGKSDGSNGEIDFSVRLNDDKLTEANETFTIAVSRLEGSEATVNGTYREAKATIVDDSVVVADLGFSGDPNDVLDGPYITLVGTKFISESAGDARYVVRLVDENGELFTADQDVTVTIEYEPCAGDGFIAAEKLNDFQIYRETVTIPAGSSEIGFAVGIPDTDFNRESRRFEVTLSEAVGNEVRIPEDGSNSVRTVIVDDTVSWDDALYGEHNGLEVINPFKDPDDESKGRVHGTDHGTLDGPVLDISGPASVAENISGGHAVYEFSLSAAVVEDVVMTIRLTPETAADASRSDCQFADLFGPGSGPGADEYDEATILGKLQAANSGTIANVAFVDPADPDKGITFDYTITNGSVSGSINIPIYNDNITEKIHDFTLEIENLSGSEVRVGQEKVTTSIIDDRLGPTVSISCWDPDIDSNAGAWAREATIVGDPANSQYTNDPYVHFKVNLSGSAVAEEDIQVRVVLRNSGNQVLAKDIPVGSDVIVEGEGASRVYVVTIKEGDPSATLSFLKNELPDPADPDNPEFGSERYTASIESVSGGESRSALGADYAIAEVDQSYTPGPWSHVKLECEDTASSESGNAIYFADEGKESTFSLIISGGSYGMRHDGAGHGTSSGVTHDISNPYEHCDGRTDYDITVTVRIVPVSGGLDQSDFNIVEFEDLNSFIKTGSSSWTTTTNGYIDLTFTVEAGTRYAQSLDPSTNQPLDIGIEFKLPIAEDLNYEGNEYYDIYVLSATSASTSSGELQEMGIHDKFTGPKLSLEHAGSDTVAEGAEQEYYLILTEPVTSSFTVTLGYADGSTASLLDGATSGKDYMPSPKTITFGSGTNGPGWEEVGGVWRYKFNVKIPDDKFSEPDEDFTVTITGCSTTNISIDPANKEVVTVIADDGNSGPLVYFTDFTQDVAESDASMRFTVNMSGPAVEEVTVRVEVIGGSAGIDEDFTFKAQSDSNLTYVKEDVGGGVFRHFFDIVFPVGKTQTPVDFGALVNDMLTEGDENFTIKIDSVKGGEARIKDGSDANHGTPGTNESVQLVTVKDSVNGPGVSVSADKTTLIEERGATGTEGDANAGPEATATFTFALTDATGQPFPDGSGGNYVAEQDITLTVRLTFNGALQGVWEGLKAQHNDAGNPLTIVSPASPETSSKPDHADFTLTIPEGQRATTWTMNYLYNDKVAESESFSVGIVKVENNEAVIGATPSVSVTVTDDDHAPTTVPDSIFILIPPQSQTADLSHTYTLNGMTGKGVLENDSDADGDTVFTKAGSAAGIYGSYTIGTDGNLSYSFDSSNNTLKLLAGGETLHENDFTYEATDKTNTSTGTASLQIKSGSVLNTGTTGKAEWLFGSGKDDTITGGGGKDVIRAGDGNDVINDYGDGLAEIYGEGGNDTLVLKSSDSSVSLANVSIFNGGTGNDALVLDGNNKTFNFTADTNISKLTSVEILDISGGNNQIDIADAAVAAFTLQLDDPATDIPRVDGALGDRVRFEPAEGWQAVDSTMVPGYHLYESTSGKRILIHENLALVVEGGSGNDTLDRTAKPDPDDTGNYALYGNDGNDSLYGGSGDDQLYGGAGGDLLDGGKSAPGTTSGDKGTRDQLDGGAGDDTLILRDTTEDGLITGGDFLLADGGGGKDVLRIAPGTASPATDVDGVSIGVTLDLTKVPAAQLKDIETIDLTDVDGNTYRNHVILGEEALAALTATLDTDAQAQLRITGSALDSYELKGTGWVYTTKTSDGGGTDWHVYESGDKELWVDAGLTRKINGTTANDIITAGPEDHVLIDAGAGNDIITGGAGSGTIYAGAGDDTIRNGSSDDRLYGEDDDDTFILSDVSGNGVINGGDFTLVNGGSGVDTVKLEGAGKTLDLSTGTTSTSQIAGVEIIDITGSGNNHVILDAAMLAQLASGLDALRTELRITGNTGDTFELEADWTFSGQADSGTWNKYVSQLGETVFVSSAMKRVYTGGDSADSFILDDVTGDGKITGADFASISGGIGDDTLTVSAGNLTIDLSAVSNGQISGVERINIADPAGLNGNHIRVSDTAVEAEHSLHVDGRDGDSFELVGNWTFQRIKTEATGDYYEFIDGTRTLLVSDALKLLYVGDSGNNTFSLIDMTGDGVITAADFAAIQGKGGTDTIKPAGTYTTLDLTGIDNGDISGVTTIDLSASGDHTLVLNDLTLTNMGLASGGVLTVTGNAGDSFELLGAWTYIGINNGNLQYQDDNGRIVEASPDLALRQSASGADTTFTLTDLDSNGVITASEVGVIAGDALYNNTLTIPVTGPDLDLTGLVAGKISNVDTIDITSNGANTLTLNAATLTAMDVTTLTVKGNSGDLFELTDAAAWTLSSSDSEYNVFTNGTLTLKVSISMMPLVQGGTIADTLSGGWQGLATVVRGEAGNDVLHVGSSGDVLDGGAGNDTVYLDAALGTGVTVTGADFGSIDGGTENDTIALLGAGNTLNLAGLGAGKISNVETIDITGTGDNLLVLNAAAVTAMGLTTLTVTGDSGDRLQLSGTGWTAQSGGEAGYALYVNGSVSVKVSETVAAQFSESGGETFLVGGVDSNGVTFDGSSLGTITGGTGAGDVIRLQGENNTLDLSALTTGKISGVETIDVTGSGDNLLKISASGLTNMGGSITVTGNAGDAYELTDLSASWTLTSSDGVYNVFTNSDGKTLTISDALFRQEYASAGGGTLSALLADDRLFGGAGADTFLLSDLTGNSTLDGNDFGLINGGSGSDVLRLSGSGLVLDMRGLTSVTNIETIDLGDNGNTLLIDQTALAALGATTVTVTGGATSSLELTGTGWTHVSSSAGFHYFTNGTQTLKIADTITRTATGDSGGGTMTVDTPSDVLYGGSGATVFVLRDLDSSGAVTGSDFGGVHGGALAGEDALQLGGTGTALDLRLLATGKISGIEIIDLAGSTGGNTLHLDGDSIDAMGLAALTVKADATDTLSLSGAWSFDGSVYSCNGITLTVDGSPSVSITAASTDTVALTGAWSFDGSEFTCGGTTLTIAGGPLVAITADPGDTVTLAGAWTFDGSEFSCGGTTLTVAGGPAVAINADSGDTVTLAGDWSFDGSAYTNGGSGIESVSVTGADYVRLTPVSASVQGAALDEVFVLTDQSGAGNIIDSDDFTLLDGGGGNDVLQLLEDNMTLDLTGLWATDFGRIEVLGGNTHIDLNTAAVQALGLEIDATHKQLLVQGDGATTTLHLDGFTADWTGNGTQTVGATTYDVYTRTDQGMELQLLLHDIISVTG